MFKSKSKKLILGILLCLCAAFFACGIFVLSNTKDRGQTVTAHAATVTPWICYDYDETTKTLTLSGSDTYPDNNNCFSGTVMLGYSNVPWYSYRKDIITVNIQTTIVPQHMSNWFNECNSLTAINNLSNIDTSRTINMAQMFNACKSLTELDLSSWNVSNAENITLMFYGCSNLTSLNLSGWHLTGVENLRFLFGECYKLKTLNLSGFSAQGVKSLEGTFYGCPLENVDLSGFNTSQVTNMTNMFMEADGVTTLDLSSWDFSSVTSGVNLFYGCKNLTELILPDGFDLPNSSVQNLFYECNSLKKLDLSSFSKSLNNSLIGCSGLEEINLSPALVSAINADTSNRNYLFLYNTTWYDKAGNSYTKTKPMTTAGTYYNEIPKCEHDWQKDTANSTVAGCLTAGVDKFECSICGEKKSETVPAIGSHDWNDWVTTTPATCTAKGVKTRTCKRDVTHTETGEVAMIAHDYNTEYTTDVEATCTTTGTKSKHCKNCTAKTDEQTIPATGHAWGEWSTTTAASCTTAGSEKRVCANNAEHTETRTVNATGHSYVANVIYPTCTEDGKTINTCSKCSNSYESNPVSATGHTYGAPVWQWTGYVSAKAIFTCGTCNHEEVKNASISKVTANASCTVAGDTTYTAKVTLNGTEYTDEKVSKGEKQPHTPKLVEESQAPTCTEMGSGLYECEVCHEQYNDAIEALGHDFADEFTTDKEATCTEDGSKSKHCSRCSETTEVTSIPATGHTPGDEATCTEPQTCDICGTELAPALGHDWATEWSKDETNHWHICSRCDEKKDETAHTCDWVITKDPTEEETGLKENICTVCGNKDGEEEIAKLIVDDKGNVSDLPVLPPNQDYDLEIAVKESDSLYNIPGITKGYKVELFVVDGENRTEYDSNKKVTLMLVIPEGMEDEFTLYCRHGDILEPVDPATYTVNGKSVTIRTTLPNEYVFNAPAPEEPETSGIPWWVWVIIGLGGATLLTIIIVFIVVAKKKKNDNTPTDNGELLQRLDNQDQVLNELLNRGDDGGFNTPVELDENGNVIFK